MGALRILLLTFIVASGIIGDACGKHLDNFAWDPSVPGDYWWNSHEHDRIGYAVAASTILSVGIHGFVKAWLVYRNNGS